jgi:hypothetical protein
VEFDRHSIFAPRGPSLINARTRVSFPMAM